MEFSRENQRTFPCSAVRSSQRLAQASTSINPEEPWIQMTKHSDAVSLLSLLQQLSLFFVAGYHGGKYLAKQENSDPKQQFSLSDAQAYRPRWMRQDVGRG